MDQSSFQSDLDALDHYRSLARSLQCDLDDTKLALDEFQVSSKELEAELERELQATEKQLSQLRGKEESLVHEIEQWKTKYHACLKDHTKTMTHMQSELDRLRKSNEEYRTRLRDMELDNDELEGKERMVTSSLQDVESKYGKAIERITLLEDELIEKSRLEEDCQRLKDDLRDTMEENAVLRDQHASHVESMPSHVTFPSGCVGSPSSSMHAEPAVAAPLSDPGIEVLKDAKHLVSPLRRGVRPRPTSLLPEDSPRRRLASLSVNTSPKTTPAKPAMASGLQKVASLRIRFPVGSPKPPAHEVVAAMPSRLGSPAGATPGLHRSASRRDLSRLAQLQRAAPNAENVDSRRSHLQSLRAETERMQGMTKKLVSSRTLRTVSAIPVPKASYLAGQSASKSVVHNLSGALGRSTGGRSPRKAAPAMQAMRTVTQPATTQDKDSDSGQSTELLRRTSRRSQGGPTGIPGIPRVRQPRAPSRLSVGSDQQLGVPPLPNRSVTPTMGVPRRQNSMECTDKLVRPSSTQGQYKGHLRRKSAGIHGPLVPETCEKRTMVVRNLALGKSLGPSAGARFGLLGSVTSSNGSSGSGSSK